MKKNLSDLLREEVAKENPTTEEKTPTTKTSRRRSATPEPESVEIFNTTESTESQELLKLELEKQQNLVKTLQEQVQEKQTLETEIQRISKQLKQSQTELEKQLQEKQALSNQLSEAQTKLDEQKHLIEKLYAELMEKQEMRSLEPEPEPESEPEPEPEPKPEPPKAIVQNFRRSSFYVERLIAPNASSKISDDVLGWFD